jgi:hypothetical protein
MVKYRRRRSTGVSREVAKVNREIVDVGWELVEMGEKDV